MSPAARQRRGLAQRPFVLFGLLMLLPAFAFGLVGWTSVLRERSLSVREAVSEAQDVLELRLDTVAGELRALEAREAERPYYHYQSKFAPEQTVFQQLDFQPTPLSRAPEDARVLGWFQWELGTKGAPERPETFAASAADAASLERGLVDAYGTALRQILQEAARSTDHLLGRRVDHSLRTVQANEERGQLIEEIQITQQQRGAEGAPNWAPAGEEGTTPYLRSFFGRVGDDPVPVRYGSFRYLARTSVHEGPPLVAWRLVWIPAVHADRREVGRDRWLLQGYALDPGPSLPETWERVGAVRLCRKECASVADRRSPLVREASLLDVLEAELVGVHTEAPAPSSRLVLVAVPDADAIRVAYAVSRNRYLLLLGGVLVVVAVGFVVLTRGMSREIALARRKEDFVAAVTHELKTPLAGIRMYADMLREGWVADEESANRYATRIIEESERLGGLVDQVLDLAALERGVARANALPGDLGEAVRDATALMETRAEQAGVTLDVEVEADLPTVTFDPKLVRPLVLNLIDNAIKYSENAETKAVRVSVRRDSDRVVLGVADQGAGIDPKLRRHLFEPFQRAGDELTRTSKGVGIGLALVKRYAEAHHARVDVESEVGRGTTVSVRFRV